VVQQEEARQSQQLDDPQLLLETSSGGAAHPVGLALVALVQPCLAQLGQLAHRL
jgi:hypothetical protein